MHLGMAATTPHSYYTGDHAHHWHAGQHRSSSWQGYTLRKEERRPESGSGLGPAPNVLAPAVVTCVPTVRESTPGPTATTTPAPSAPSANSEACAFLANLRVGDCQWEPALRHADMTFLRDCKFTETKNVSTLRLHNCISMDARSQLQWISVKWTPITSNPGPKPCSCWSSHRCKNKNKDST